MLLDYARDKGWEVEIYTVSVYSEEDSEGSATWNILNLAKRHQCDQIKLQVREYVVERLAVLNEGS